MGKTRQEVLQISQDIGFEKLSWKIERFGWTIIAVVLVAALLGMFGGGPLARAVVDSGSDAIRIEYDRWARYQAPTDLKIYINSDAIQNGKTKISLSRDYLSSMKVEDIQPEPISTEASPERLTYLFDVGT